MNKADPVCCGWWSQYHAWCTACQSCRYVTSGNPEGMPLQCDVCGSKVEVRQREPVSADDVWAALRSHDSDTGSREESDSSRTGKGK
jgi:hypothetical protein